MEKYKKRPPILLDIASLPDRGFSCDGNVFIEALEKIGFNNATLATIASALNFNVKAGILQKTDKNHFHF